MVLEVLTASGGDGGPYTFTVSGGSLPDGVTFIEATAAVYGWPTESGTFAFTVTASDGSGHSGSQAFSWFVWPMVTVFPETLAAMVAGYPASFRFTAQGGTGGPFTFTLESGQIPTGMTLDAATGILSGTPTVTGVWQFAIRATSGTSHGSRLYIRNVGGGITFGPESFVPFRVGESRQIGLFAHGGGGGPYTYAVSAGALPEGVTLSPAGLVGGMPISDGPYSVTITVTDNLGTTASRTYSGQVEGPVALTYFLAEGASSEFFDETIAIVNPNDAGAQIAMTFLRQDGIPITNFSSMVPQSRTTYQVRHSVGPAPTSASVRVTSVTGVPLAVERTMTWDASGYGGHAETAVASLANRWYFAEGAQGFFDTYLLVANPQATPATVTLTFLVEDGEPITIVVTMAAQSRATVPASTIAGLANRSFGVIVEATQPVAAERAMYFGMVTPGRPWRGGHDAAGVTTPSQSWYLAEAATGGFFDTFVLLMNPQNVDARVTVRYLLPSGDTVDVPKMVPAQRRLTVNIETESDPRLQHASMAVVVDSDVPIVVERSVYWGAGTNGIVWEESHNSFGVTAAGLRWAVAEGQSGGPQNHRTYVLLANPSTAAAHVTVSFLTTTNPPIVRAYTVAPTSRLTIDVRAEIPELEGRQFGAGAVSDVPVVMERSIYWDALGTVWAGGTNALGTRMP